MSLDRSRALGTIGQIQGKEERRGRSCTGPRFDDLVGVGAVR